jgi:hypothetical protein
MEVVMMKFVPVEVHAMVIVHLSMQGAMTCESTLSSFCLQSA